MCVCVCVRVPFLNQSDKTTLNLACVHFPVLATGCMFFLWRVFLYCLLLYTLLRLFCLQSLSLICQYFITLVRFNTLSSSFTLRMKTQGHFFSNYSSVILFRNLFSVLIVLM